MRLLFLALIFGSQVFGAAQTLESESLQVPGYEVIPPLALELAVGQVLGVFPEGSRSTIKTGVREALSKVNPAHLIELLRLTIDRLRGHNDDISSSFIEGVIAGIDAGIDAGLNSVKNNPVVAFQPPIERTMDVVNQDIESDYQDADDEDNSQPAIRTTE